MVLLSLQLSLSLCYHYSCAQLSWNLNYDIQELLFSTGSFRTQTLTSDFPSSSLQSKRKTKFLSVLKVIVILQVHKNREFKKEGKNSRFTFQRFYRSMRSVLCWSLQRFLLCSILEVKVTISTFSQNIYIQLTDLVVKGKSQPPPSIPAGWQKLPPFKSFFPYVAGVERAQRNTSSATFFYF